jgi:hypothetical protein
VAAYVNWLGGRQPHARSLVPPLALREAPLCWERGNGVLFHRRRPTHSHVAESPNTSQWLSTEIETYASTVARHISDLSYQRLATSISARSVRVGTRFKDLENERFNTFQRDLNNAARQVQYFAAGINRKQPTHSFPSLK